MTPEQVKIILSAEDKTAAAFASARTAVAKLGLNMDTFKAQAASALSALAVPVSVAGFVSMINSARTAVDKLKDIEDATGANIEKLSALDTLARSTGGNIDVVGSALVKFNSVLKDSDPDKGAGAVLKSLNLDTERLKGLDPADALREVAVALQGYADDGNKARAVQELFGKSVREVAPFLKDLAEAKRLDATLTAAQVEQVDKFNKEWAKLTTRAEDFGRVVSIDVISSINTMIERFEAGSKAGQGFFATAAAVYAQNVRDVYGIGQQQQTGSRSVSGIIVNEADQSQAEMAKLARGAPPKMSLSIPNAPKVGTSGGGKSSADKSLSDYQRLLDDYANAEDANRMKVIRDRIKQEEADLAAALSASRQPAIDELETLEARNKAYQDWLKNLQDQTPTAQLEAQRQAMADLAAEYERGTFGAAGSAEAIAKYGETVNTYLGNVEAGVKQVNATADAAGSIFGSWLDKAITDGAKLSDVISGLINDLVRLAIQKSVIEPAASGFSKFVAGLGGSGGSTGGVDSFNIWETYDGGGYTGAGARSGGVDGKGGFPAILHPNETVVDHSRGQSLGSGAVVNQTFNIGSGADASTVSQLKAAAKQIKAETEASIFSQINRGGAWSRAVGRV